ncbi:Uma2 family endonuclease [Gloeobacter violaceus]|uniref:Glr1675 protein n=1 Tax=Gloeobacter violaceus (strain ATCC 29082 / PCC 7421) TaxID=251221 RepID=Q7NK06_GLOVI|nr:Uma2 family endonuclease [Gloeobacter violaceus]BAC89616.1 glr1675 [Gloeobacter violaceus PCC 7421]
MRTRLTLQEFLELPDDDTALELIDGQAVPKVSPKFLHATIQDALLQLIRARCRGRGRVRAEWGVILKRGGVDWVPVPDLTYISYERLPSEWRRNEACPVAPEFVVEVVSPGQSLETFATKARDYLAAGILHVWVADPQPETIAIYSADGTARVYSTDVAIPGPPGLHLSAKQVFLAAQQLDQ